ncbi:MAG: TetR/AcrR family transcriptional regulator [Bacteroidales bacterium]|nr:TetR/AcrR family transcriptional regulator [Bacteroidales bacterium]
MKKPPKISRKEQKIADLYRFYLNNGFDHTIDEIATLMKIGRKTFYNRYLNKENSIQMALRYCHNLFVERFSEKTIECNHSIEELLLLMWEFQQFAKYQAVYFQYDWDKLLFYTDETPFRSVIDTIVRKGIRSYQIQEDVDTSDYSDFFYTNMSMYVMYGKKKPAILRYVLFSILNERGVELLNELNLEAFA